MKYRTRSPKQGFLFLTLLISVLLPSLAFGVSVPLNLVNQGMFGDTRIFRADLTGIAGLSQVASISLTDDGTPIGGASGIFSGFDLDGIFLDIDGSLATAGDRFFASSFVFNAGSIRPPDFIPRELPSAAHPGPTFGSLNASTVDESTASLNVFDANAVADVDLADGFLTFGDGGFLGANFNPNVPIGSSMYLFVGEVGGQSGEGIGASVEVSDLPAVPEPSTILLFGSGLLGLAAYRWRRSSRF